jgi:hypothetical protein
MLRNRIKDMNVGKDQVDVDLYVKMCTSFHSLFKGGLIAYCKHALQGLICKCAPRLLNDLLEYYKLLESRIKPNNLSKNI